MMAVVTDESLVNQWAEPWDTHLVSWTAGSLAENSVNLTAEHLAVLMAGNLAGN